MTKELEYLTLFLIRKYKDEILRERDWWFGLAEYSINVHDYNDEDVFHINIYKVGENGMDDYTHSEDLPSLTKKELKAL